MFLITIPTIISYLFVNRYQELNKCDLIIRFYIDVFI